MRPSFVGRTRRPRLRYRRARIRSLLTGHGILVRADAGPPEPSSSIRRSDRVASTGMPDQTAQPSYRALLDVPYIGRVVTSMSLARVAQSMLGVAIVLFTLPA